MSRGRRECEREHALSRRAKALMACNRPSCRSGPLVLCFIAVSAHFAFDKRVLISRQRTLPNAEIVRGKCETKKLKFTLMRQFSLKFTITATITFRKWCCKQVGGTGTRISARISVDLVLSPQSWLCSLTNSFLPPAPASATLYAPCFHAAVIRAIKANWSHWLEQILGGMH